MTVCGIDFGTSNSALAIAHEGKVELTKVEGNYTTIPSAIFYHADGKPEYGRAATKSYFHGDEGRFMRSFKRTLGTDLIEFGAIINGKLKRFDHIIAGFLRHMKDEAEKDCGHAIESVVMGRPVHFVDGDNDADNLAQNQLHRMAKLVGFKHIEFQFEPIAAAFAHEQNVHREKLAMVVDIGGGTSDFSIIKLSPQNKGKPDRADDILASSGVRIGGNDFDRDFCLKSFMPHLGMDTAYGEKGLKVPLSPFFEISEWSKVNTLYTPKLLKEFKGMLASSHEKQKLKRFVKALEKKQGYALLTTVEGAKINLTSQISAKADLGFLEDNFYINTSRDEFNDSVRKYIDGIDNEIKNCLKLAGIKHSEIEMIVLTGGTTEVLALQQRISALFPHAEISNENKLSSVCTGLGWDSLRRFG